MINPRGKRRTLFERQPSARYSMSLNEMILKVTLAGCGLHFSNDGNFLSVKLFAPSDWATQEQVDTDTGNLVVVRKIDLGLVKRETALEGYITQNIRAMVLELADLNNKTAEGFK